MKNKLKGEQTMMHTTTNCCGALAGGHYSTKCPKCFSGKDEWDLYYDLIETEMVALLKGEITTEVYNDNVRRINKHEKPSNE